MKSANLEIHPAKPAGWRRGGGPGEKKDAVLQNGVPRNQGAPGWHSRGYLPHFESCEAIQHVTFHLADSVPKTVLLRLENELKDIPEGKRDAERRKRLDAWIDAGHGSCVLREPGIAEMVQGSLLCFDGQRYRLMAWVVMPNHVHVLFKPMNGWMVAKIVASWKKFTARAICDWRRANGEELVSPGLAKRQSGDRRSRRSQGVWHREYWDRYIRDGKHFEQVVEYIRLNPVKAGLVETAGSWRWSSAYQGNLGKVTGAILENGVPRKIAPVGWGTGIRR